MSDKQYTDWYKKKENDLLKAKLQYSTEKIDNKIITMHCNEIDAETYSSEDIKEQKKGSGEYWKIVQKEKAKEKYDAILSENIYKLRENEQVQVNLAAMLQYDLRESYTMIRYLRLRGDVFTKNKVYMLLYNSCLCFHEERKE